MFLFTGLYAQSKIEKLSNKDTTVGYNIKLYNPIAFSPSNLLEVSIADTSETKLFVLSVGKEDIINYNDTVAVIYQGKTAPGRYKVVWDSKNSENKYVKSGHYIIAVNCLTKKGGFVIKTFSGQVPILVLN